MFPEGWADAPPYPTTLHNRFFAPNNTYMSNFSFILDNAAATCALPQDEGMFR
jgi:hypothetical protein